jgi:hypothetical protein
MHTQVSSVRAATIGFVIANGALSRTVLGTIFSISRLASRGVRLDAGVAADEASS